MKNLRTSVLCVCITLCSFHTFAQTDRVPINEPNYKKPHLFDNLPDKIPVSMDYLNSLFSSPIGRSVSLSVAQNKEFDGSVTSSASKYDNSIQSVTLRSTNFSGAQFTVSRLTRPDGLVSYTGRIISFQHGDLFELQNQSGSFVLVKRNYYELVNE